MTRRRKWRGHRRPRIVVVVAAVVALLAVAATSATALAYGHQQQKITAARRTLDRSLAHEAQLQRDLATAHRAAEAARATAAQHRDGTRTEQASTRHVAALASTAAKDADRARKTLQISTLQRALLGMGTQQARACLAAERAAMDNVQAADSGAAVAALNAGVSSCAGALAGATGARFPYDFADPFVLTVGDRYYAFSTNSGAGDVQVITSTDLVNWSLVGNALAGLPAWATRGMTWAPSILHLPATATRPEAYVMYYTVRDAKSGAQCISSAVAGSPAGPYYDRTQGPVVCEVADGGSIDPSPFVDRDGSMYLLWKREHILHPSTLQIGRLAPGARGLLGPSVDLLHSDRAWQHGVIEAPSMVHTAAGYFLVFAGGIWYSSSYATGIARCDTPTGPCHEQPAPVMTSNDTVVGPGGATAFTDRDGALWLAYAAYANPFVGWPYSRTLRFAAVTIGASSVTVAPA